MIRTDTLLKPTRHTRDGQRRPQEPWTRAEDIKWTPCRRVPGGRPEARTFGLNVNNYSSFTVNSETKAVLCFLFFFKEGSSRPG